MIDKKTYDELIDLLIKYSDSYYKDNISLVSDEQFDHLLKEAEEIERLHPEWLRLDSPTLHPGSDLVDLDESNSHSRPMLSLENTYNEEDISKWYEKMTEFVDNPEIIVEYKYDGNSCAIRFDHGKVYKSLTRGNGTIGEDITNNVSTLSDAKKIKSIFNGEVRGEIIMSKEDFKMINKYGEYANARNLASGTLKLLDVEEFKKRPLRFYAYWLENSTNRYHSQDLEQLKALGFRVGDYFICKSLPQLIKTMKYIEENKNNLEVEIDGAVMKLNDKSLWEEIGSTAKFPRWAKAFKFHQEVQETEVLSIDFQVGRSGKVTPVANLTPILLDGSTVTRATLNNATYLKQIDVRVGDFVYVQKAAAIIPQIIGINFNKRKPSLLPVEFPSYCPECQTKLVRYIDKADTFCPNENCPARIQDKINYYTTTLEIDGFGDDIVERLHFLGYLNSIEDLYHLDEHKAELVQLDRFGEKSISKLITNVMNSKSQPAEKLLAALGIKGVGEKIAKIIMKKYHSFYELGRASISDLALIDGIGDIKAEDIFNTLHSSYIVNLLNHLRDLGVNLVSSVSVNTRQTALSDKSVCITGALEYMTRKEYEKLIEEAGGKNVTSVTSKTDYLVTNDTTSGSNKNKKAQELGIPVIDEKELRRLLEI